MADITKSSGDGAKVSTHVLNGPATKEPTLKYSPQDPGLMKETIPKPNATNSTSGKSKETRFEIVNVSSYSYTEDPSVDELEETSNTEDLTSEHREVSQADELEEGEPSSDGLNSAEDAANGSHPTSTRESGSTSHPLQSKPVTSTPTNQPSTKAKSLSLINGVESDGTSSTALDPVKFSANSSNVTLTSRNEGGDSFANVRDDPYQSSSPMGSSGATKPGILTSGVVTPTGDAVVTSYTTSHGTWSTSGADFVQHSDSSMEPSRFRVVKIHNDKKIRRGRWQCQDYYDASSEKAAANKDSEAKASLPDGGSGNSSAASSVHYVHGENPASENPLVKIMAENPPDEFIPTILTTTDSQKFLVIPQFPEAKGPWGMQTPGNVFAGDHPLLQHTQHNIRALAQNASQPSHGTPVGHHQPASTFGTVEVSNSKSSPEPQIKDIDNGTSKVGEGYGKSSPESIHPIPLAMSQSTSRPTSHAHPNFNSNSCSFVGDKEIENASHSGDAERGRRDTTSFDGHGSPVRIKTGSEPPTIPSGVHVLPLVQTPNPKEEVRNPMPFPSASMPNSNELVAKVASIPDLRAGGSSVATPVSSDQGPHPTKLTDNSATSQHQQQQSATSSTNQNSGRGYQLPSDANFGAFPPSGGSSPSVPSASKESSPQSRRATPSTTSATTSTTTSIHTNVSSPPSVTAQAHASSSVMLPAGSNQPATTGQFPNAQNASTPVKQLPPNLSIQSSSSASASSHPAAQNIVNSAKPPQQPSPSSAVPSPTPVGGSLAQPTSANMPTSAVESQPSLQQSTLPNRGSQQAFPTGSIDKESSQSKVSAAESSDPSNLQQSHLQHPKAPSMMENEKPSQPDKQERDKKLPSTTAVSPPKPASLSSTMTQDSVTEKPSLPPTSRFKVTGVPENEAATAFKPAVSQLPPNSTLDASSTTRDDDVEGGSRRPTTIPLDSASNASRRGSINDPPSAGERVLSVGGGKTEGDDKMATSNEGDPDLAGDTILDLKQELREGVSPLSRQSSKRDVDVESEGSGTEEGAGVSTVAIDNKIEQAMDLVKSHLMFAVREEVEVLKEQIKELIEKNQQLEMENAYLKSNATPDLLKQLQAHVDSSPTPPPVMAAPVCANLQSATPGNATGFGTGQFSTQVVTSHTSGGAATGATSATASAASVNVTHTIGPTGGSSSQSIPSSIPSNAPAPTGGGAYLSSSPSNP